MCVCIYTRETTPEKHPFKTALFQDSSPHAPALKFIQQWYRDNHLFLHLKRWQLTYSQEMLQGNKNPRQIEDGIS